MKLVPEKVKLIFQKSGYAEGMRRILRAVIRRCYIYVNSLYWKRVLRSAGQGLVVEKRVKIDNPRNIVLGKGCHLANGVTLYSETFSSRLTCGDHIVIGEHGWVDYSGDIKIGDYTLISKEAILYTHNHSYDPYSKPAYSKLEIGSHVWIGARAIILASVNTIGDGVIIGTGAVVTKNVEPSSIVVGNPARAVGARNIT